MILKISIATFLVMISSLLFTNSVSASSTLFESSSDEYLYGGFTKDNLQTIIDYNNLDTTIYDSVILYYSKPNETWRIFGVLFYSSSNESRIFIKDDGKFYGIRNSSTTINIASSELSSSFTNTTSSIDLSNINYNKTLTIQNSYSFSITGGGEILYKGLISEALATEPTSYEFNEDIDVSDISKIKVNFQLPEDTSNLQLKLDFSVNGLTENVGIIGFPYILLTSLNDNNNSMTNVVDFDYNLNNKNALIAQMCAIVNCYDLFEPNEYTAQFNKMIGNLEKINSNSSNKSTLILNELNTWYTEEYVNLLYDHALNLVDKTYMNNNNYSDSFNVNLLPDSTVYDYSLEINTIDYTGTLNLSFVSNLNYSISYEYESEVEDYYLTLDLNNYAAAVLIPKVINTNSSESNSFLSDIYLSGIYDIELWEDIDSKNVLFRHSNYSSNAFSHYFDYRYPNSVLYFIKKENFNGNSSIKIDTRYYSYLLLSTLSSGGSIVNPNTNQEITIPSISDLYDYDFGGDDITSIKDNIMYFFKNIESLGKMILEPVQSFFDSLPPTMKIGIIVLFVIFIAVGIIKMIL